VEEKSFQDHGRENGHAAWTIAQTVSVVVPTRNEEKNVAPLIARTERALGRKKLELIFVDDSDDATPTFVEAAAAMAAFPIELIHRPAGKRRGGLGSAVLDGMRSAHTAWICVMDGDLQHPPELIPALVAKAEASGAEVVIASRYARDGSADGLGAGRALLSGAAAGAARLAFPRRLRAVSDPMSGFFLVRRDAIDFDALHPKGFKILVEILARHRDLGVAEIPFVFGARFHGETKASLREGIVYGLQLLRLRAAAFRDVGPPFSRRAAMHVRGFRSAPVDKESICGS
jgi:dolichol-phosphate mannosyltransferase